MPHEYPEPLLKAGLAASRALNPDSRQPDPVPDGVTDTDPDNPDLGGRTEEEEPGRDDLPDAAALLAGLDDEPPAQKALLVTKAPPSFAPPPSDYQPFGDGESVQQSNQADGGLDGILVAESLTE